MFGQECYYLYSFEIADCEILSYYYIHLPYGFNIQNTIPLINSFIIRYIHFAVYIQLNYPPSVAYLNFKRKNVSHLQREL